MHDAERVIWRPRWLKVGIKAAMLRLRFTAIRSNGGRRDVCGGDHRGALPLTQPPKTGQRRYIPMTSTSLPIFIQLMLLHQEVLYHLLCAATRAPILQLLLLLPGRR